MLHLKVKYDQLNPCKHWGFHVGVAADPISLR